MIVEIYTDWKITNESVSEKYNAHNGRMEEPRDHLKYEHHDKLIDRCFKNKWQNIVTN